MIGSYGDDMVPAGAANDPRAPWNRAEPLPICLQCDSCKEPPPPYEDFEVGDACRNTQPEFDRAGNEIPPCEGRYIDINNQET